MALGKMVSANKDRLKYYIVRDYNCEDIAGIYADYNSCLPGGGWYAAPLEVITQAEFETYREFGIHEIKIDDRCGYDWKTRELLGY